MTRVHLAKHVETGQLAVVKELNAAWSDSTEGVRAFDREVQVTKRLDHPGIAKIYSDGIDDLDKKYYYITEFADGGNLKDVIMDEAPLSEDRIKQIGIEIGDALEYCHTFEVPANPRLHIVHRDLKPSNILVMKDRSLKISDFGKVKLSETVAATGRTMSSCNDPGYASPEWLKGLTVDARTDIYSLGVILYELATRKRPHVPEDPDVFAQWAKAKEELPVAPSEFNPLISSGLEEIILKALEPDRGKRYQTARELVEDLRQCVSDGNEPEPVLPDSETEMASSSNEQVGINSMGSMLNVRTGPDLVMASCAYLTFVNGMDSFSRSDILDEMKLATGYYQENHRKNLSAILERLTKNGKLVKGAGETYFIEDQTKKELKERLA
jgi:serine/threonine-protein kinase